jgi:uncharacterized membrane protein
MPPDDRAPPAVASDPDPALAGQPEAASPEVAPSGGLATSQSAGAGGADGTARDRAAGPDPVAWLIALAAFAAYGLLSVYKYARLDPGSWDLGIFTEYVKQVAHLHAPVVAIRGTGFNLLGDHFQPIVMLIAPFFRLFPSPVTLLIAQALLTAVSVIPVCRAARELLGKWPSWGIGLAYAFSWGLQQMINFDFHEIAFAVPLLAFSLSALVRRKLWPTVLWALPLVFVKEDQGFTIAAIGLVMVGMGCASPGERPPRTPRGADGAWAAGRQAPSRGVDSGNPSGENPQLPQGLVTSSRGLDPRERSVWIRAGIVLAVWGLAWSALAIAVIIPHFNPGHHYPYWDNGGVVAPGGHLSLSGVAHQFAVAGTEKLWTVYLILLPVAFLALRSPFALIAVPSLVLRFVSTNSYYWGDGWHYNATVMPIVFLAAIDGMARFRAASARRTERTGRRVRRVPYPAEAVARYGAVVMVVIAGWLAFRFPLAGLWQAQTYQITPHVRAEDAAIAKVPDGVVAEATLTMLAPLAARDDTYWIGTSPNPAPQYVVFDNDDSGWSWMPDPLQFVEQRHPGWAYRRIFLDNNVYVFQREGRTGG